jgi:peptidoglycan LD-endopeptidase LytH
MRSSRSLLSFAAGAISVLAVVIAVEWAAPGAVSRVHAALQPGAAIPGATAEAPGATAPAALDTTAPTAPVVLAPADPAGADVPGVGTPELPAAPQVPAADDGLGLLIPVQGVAAASLVDTYEQARGQGRRHDAIDIMAPRGTPVLATANGVVMKLFQSERGGITLYELAPDRRTIYYYAHLDRYAPGIAEGQALRRGQLLGYVGNTGDAGPGNYHLHFEVSTTTDPKRYWGGVPQNPYPLLR